ncbi:MAG: 50S ribosomal protein L13 [Bacteroidales bacterium]
MDSNSYKTLSAKQEDVNKEWVLIDAKDEVLGRLASQAAKIIRGKHKPGYTPHIDCGDKVVIVNAEQVRLTGNKWTGKEYVHYTGYPGGQRKRTPKDLMEKDPRMIIEKAIHGMLPKNRLGRKLKKNLFVYVGEEHPHEAQKPKKLKLKDIK